ncbi:hypothetical protein [Streptomyces sp. NBC_01565]|uniref:hypothetical protein n=1 Tax=Streptomyces sp. NBC_01565 TaxID=2975881 RepID=UPI0022535BFB|nr:hypothetical protein [Streptomyces sp. NBC_01565]MCX4540501.1 hypothetical protein [Streptomyces sp. NBC_01565]
MTPARAKGAAEQSWDQFWDEVRGRRTTVIRGIEVPVPGDMPMRLRRRIEELQDSEDEEHIAELVALLFGQDVFGAWEDAGIGAFEFQVILTWGIAQATGREGFTFEQAFDAVRNGEEGKALGVQPPNRAARRSQSAATGGRSKPTSRASTGSARRTSRT